MMCHSIDPNVNAFEFNGYGAAWRDVLFNQIAPGSDDIFDPTQEQREAATTDPALLDQDSDGDTYSNAAELMFGTDPGDPSSFSSRPQPLVEAWAKRLRDAIPTIDLATAEADPRVQHAGPDSDGDGVPDLLEKFAGTDSNDPASTPITSARRLAVYRQILIDLGVQSIP